MLSGNCTEALPIQANVAISGSSAKLIKNDIAPLPFPFHEPSVAPTGFGLRQSSGALAMEASQPKAPEDWRSPRRYRAIRRIMVPMHAKNRKGAFHEPPGDGTGPTGCRPGPLTRRVERFMV